MKKTLLFVLLALTTTLSFGQLEIKPGVRIGANFSSLTNSSGLDTKTDFYIGALAAFEFVHFYTLQPELTYSRQGAEFNTLEGDLELNYLGLNIINKFSPVKDFGLHFLVGPGLNFKVSDNLSSEKFDDASDVSGFDLTLIAGLGYDFPFGLSIETRYNIGLVDILGSNVNDTDGDGSDASFIRLNSTFQIGLIYKFDLN